MKATKKDIKIMREAYQRLLNEMFFEVNTYLPYLIQATEEKKLSRKWGPEFFKETAEEYAVMKARDFLDKKEAEYKIMQQTRNALGEPGF